MKKLGVSEVSDVNWCYCCCCANGRAAHEHTYPRLPSMFSLPSPPHHGHAQRQMP